MNQKIKCLIDGGFITIADVLEYSEDHNSAIIYNNEQIDRYYQEEYAQDEMTEGDYNAILENLYGKNPTGWVDGLENIQ